MYRKSPVVKFIEAHTLGAAAMATQATLIRTENLGLSSGEAGQSFRLQHFPILKLVEGEDVEVEEKVDDELRFVPWQRVKDFADSDRFDRHYMLEEATGEVQFGPAVRQPDGGVCQYGRVPSAGQRIRISQYRYGGGSKGNVPEGKIRLMRSAVPFVDRVTNFEKARGGRDQENLDEVKLRARRELRSQKRAVTAEDFETLGKAANPNKIARIKCLGGGEGASDDALPGVIDLLVVPGGLGTILAEDIHRLALSPELIIEISNHLNQFRLLTTTLRIRPPAYVGVKVTAKIAVDRPSQAKLIQERVNRVLRLYLSPFPLEEIDRKSLIRDDLKSLSEEDPQDEWLLPEWGGWPFGRTLFASELYTFIQKVRGVRHIISITLEKINPIVPQANGLPKPDAGDLAFTGEIKIKNGETLCSFIHEIEVVNP
jgi:predicted phage baseplate assembly protein